MLGCSGYRRMGRGRKGEDSEGGGGGGGKKSLRQRNQYVFLS